MRTFLAISAALVTLAGPMAVLSAVTAFGLAVGLDQDWFSPTTKEAWAIKVLYFCILFILMCIIYVTARLTSKILPVASKRQ